MLPQARIAAFLARYVSRPFRYLDNDVGVEINFNKIFYQPERLRPLAVIQKELGALEKTLQELEAELF